VPRAALGRAAVWVAVFCVYVQLLAAALCPAGQSARRPAKPPSRSAMPRSERSATDRATARRRHPPIIVRSAPFTAARPSRWRRPPSTRHPSSSRLVSSSGRPSPSRRDHAALRALRHADRPPGPDRRL